MNHSVWMAPWAHGENHPQGQTWGVKKEKALVVAALVGALSLWDVQSQPAPDAPHFPVRKEMQNGIVNLTNIPVAGNTRNTPRTVSESAEIPLDPSRTYFDGMSYSFQTDIPADASEIQGEASFPWTTLRNGIATEIMKELPVMFEKTRTGIVGHIPPPDDAEDPLRTLTQKEVILSISYKTPDWMTHQKNFKVTMNFLPEWTRVNISPTVNLSSWVIWGMTFPEDSNMSLTAASLIPEDGNPKNSTSLAVESSQWMATIGTKAKAEDGTEGEIGVPWGRYKLKVHVVWGPTGWDPQYSTEIQAPVRVVHGLEELLSKEYRVHAWNELIIDIWALGAILDLSWPLTLEYFPDYRESDAHETLDAGKYYRDPDGQLHMSTAGLPPGLGRVRLVGQDRNGEVSEVDITIRILGDAPFTAGHMEGYDPDTQVLTIGGWNNADLYGIYDKEDFEENVLIIGWNKVRYTRVTDGDRTYFTLVFPSGFQYGREYAFDITAFKVDINGNPIGAYGTPVKFFLPQPMSQAPTIKGMAIHRSYN